MMKRALSLPAATLGLWSVLTFSAPSARAANPSEAQSARDNPLMESSKLPFQAPRFDQIKEDDFKPAVEAGIAEQLQEIQAIADNPAPPTFDNTLKALEKSGRLLNRATSVFDALCSANTDPKLQGDQEELAPKRAAQRDAIFLNDKLFERVETLYRQRDQLKLDAESRRLLEYYHQQFVLAGARLSGDDKARLKKLNEEEASLSTKFKNQLLAAAKAGALVVKDKSKLAGLPAGELAAAAETARSRALSNTWVIALQNTTQQPDLRSLQDRATRVALFHAAWTRAERGDTNDTRATIKRIAEIRAAKAQLLGYPNYAAWNLQDQMAKTPQAVEEFLGRLVPPATAKARREAANIQALIDKQQGGFQLEPWDWNFYSEQVRKAKYDLDESELKPYFELDRVLQDGVFYAAHLLYGLTFKERHDLPVYQEDVRVFDVFDKDGSPLALFYCDYFKRDNKSGGAWMGNFVEQSRLLGAKPVIYNVANFTKPAPGLPALLSYDDVTTMFHEFGHALHGLFADQEYPSLSGTSVARDFVEFPSQFNEHWALDPEVLKHYAIHCKTGEPMPQALVDKIRKASKFNQGYMLTELLAAANLDMQWHTRSAGRPVAEVDPFEIAALKKTGLDLPQVPPRYRSSYFLHIWANGYAAGYYAYLWTEMLDHDAFAWFKAHGGLTRENGDRFRKLILSRGNTADYETIYEQFRGRAPDIKPMLEARGLLGD